MMNRSNGKGTVVKSGLDEPLISPPGATQTLGVVVVHRPGRAVLDLPSVVDLLRQVDELLVIINGSEAQASAAAAARESPGTRMLSFPSNRGTASAWNAAMRWGVDHGYSYLYILDQDSTPLPTAVGDALEAFRVANVAAVVQPPFHEGLRTVSFPWDTVASGSLYDVNALLSVGGFDERLFVDEVDHELLARLIGAGYKVKPLGTQTIRHQVGSPREVRILGRTAWMLGHDADRHRLRGFSTGLLLRRYMRRTPSTAARLLGREAVQAVKDCIGGEGTAARALLSGMLRGAATKDPPAGAAERACPYCTGPLLGRFRAVTDWRFGTGECGDLYRCLGCGAIAAGSTPSATELASWYSDYYTHSVPSARRRLWSRAWPTPARREEMAAQRRYFTTPGESGRFLEVGTGSGGRLVEFADAGWDVVGQDLDPKAGHLARSRGIPVHACPVGELVGREGPFDLIGLTHVLEHATDPRELLRACAGLLAPSGRICVISPNAQSLGRLLFGRWWFGLEQPRHLGIPTLESMRRLTSEVGLEVVHAETAATNAAVILGGSLARIVDERLPPGRARGAASFSMHLLGQVIGRAAVVVDPHLGEEVVWVGRRTDR